MKCIKRITSVAISVAFGCSLMSSVAMAGNNNAMGGNNAMGNTQKESKGQSQGPGAVMMHGANTAKNIIFMVPDGQGLSNVTAARIFKNGEDGDLLYQETLENIGYQRTHSANSTVTDSAAAASAWASGEKFDNGEISCHGDSTDGSCEDAVPTILEIAAGMGKATGLVATSQISHATPAAFGAHTFSRNCGAEIARQYIAETDVDVILGGGLYKTVDGCSVYAESFAPEDKRAYIIDLAEEDGYSFVSDKTELDEALSAGATKVLGMFEQAGTGQGKTPELFWVDESAEYPEGEPTIGEMTSAALNILEKDRDGLFLMVEGSQVDWADHAWDDEYQIAESLAFDESVRIVLEWVNATPERKDNTLVIIVADHDCGGYAVTGPYGSLTGSGNIVEGTFSSTNHTAVDTIIYSQGPGSEKLNAAVDNTDLYEVMKDALR